jgi:hypothetical protein
VLAYHLSAAADLRPSQLVAWGVNPKSIIFINLNGKQLDAAHNIIGYIIDVNDEKKPQAVEDVKTFARALEEQVNKQEQKRSQTTYADFLKSQRSVFLEKLHTVITAPDDKYTFWIKVKDNCLKDLRYVLAYYLSPTVNDRIDQLIGLGVNPELIPRIKLDGDQYEAARHISQFLADENGLGPSAIRSFAKALEKEVEQY